MMLTCSMCHAQKPEEAFSRDSRHISGRQSQCKPCAAATVKKWRQTNPVRARITQMQAEERNPERHLFTKFGIRQADKKAIFEKQGEACGACGIANHRHPRITGDSGWCLDHCHTTGQIRGVLCWYCNLALGYLDDSIKKLRGLIDYLDNASRNPLVLSELVAPAHVRKIRSSMTADQRRAVKRESNRKYREKKRNILALGRGTAEVTRGKIGGSGMAQVIPVPVAEPRIVAATRRWTDRRRVA